MTKQTKPIQIGLVCFSFKQLRSVQEIPPPQQRFSYKTQGK